MTAIDAFYTDINFHLLENPLTGDIPKLNDLDCIKRSLKNICTMEKWNYPFNPTVHSYLTDVLFDLPDNLSASNIKSKIKWLIDNFEPRIITGKIDVFILNSEDGYSIEIEYVVKQTLQQGLVSFNILRIR